MVAAHVTNQYGRDGHHAEEVERVHSCSVAHSPRPRRVATYLARGCPLLRPRRWRKAERVTATVAVRERNPMKSKNR